MITYSSGFSPSNVPGLVIHTTTSAQTDNTLFIDTGEVRPACIVSGTCSVGDELIEYTDGLVIGYCVECNRRIEIPRVPGSFVVPQLRALIAQTYDKDTDLSELIGEFSELLASYKRETEALEEIQALLKIVQGVLESRSGEKLGTSL